MPLGIGNNLIKNGGGLNPDKLALDLQFAADKTLTARRGPTPNFTRGSTGTFVGSNGLIQSAAINAPRFDHDPANPIVCRGLLIEEQRQNLTWPSIYTTSNLGVGVFPAGSTTISFNQSSIGTDLSGAALIRETATTQVHGIYVGTLRSATPAGVPIVSGTVYTASIFVKGDGRTKCRFSFNTGSNIDGIFATFDISSTGSIITNSTAYGSGASAAGISASIVKHINGWFRLSVSGSLTNNGGFVTVETLDDAGNRSFLGDTSKGLFIANAQLEAGSFPTSYIPTTTSALTRSADVCSITGANFTNLWNTAGGTFLFEGVLPNAPNLNNRYLLSSGGTRRWAYGNSAGQGGILETIAAFDGSTTPNYFTNVRLTTKFKLAISVEALACRASFNGSTVISISHNGNLLNSVTLLALCEGGAGTITGVRYYRKNLPNAKLQAITA